MFAKLLSLNPSTSPSIEISKPIFTIGRDQKNDKVFSDIKVSSSHLTIEYKDSQFTVTDYSSNGTYINEKKIGKGNTVSILNGDKIHLLPIQKVKEYEVIGFEFVVCQNNEQQASKISIESIDRQISDGKREVQNEKLLDTKLVENIVEQEINNEPPKKKEQSPIPVPKIDGLEDELQCTICNDYLFEAVAANPCNHHFCGSCLSNWFKKLTYECPNCRTKLTGVMQARTINNLVEKWLKINPHEKRTEQLLNKMKEENLIYKNPQEYINLNAKLNQDKQENKVQMPQNYWDEQDELELHSDEDEEGENYSHDEEDDEYLSNDEKFDDNRQNQQLQQQQLFPIQFNQFNPNFQPLPPYFYKNNYQIGVGQNLLQQQFIQPNKECKSCNGKMWKNFQCPPLQQHVGCASCARLMPKLDPSEADNEVLQIELLYEFVLCFNNICKAYHCTFYYGDCNNAALQKFMLVKNIQHQMVIPFHYVNSAEYNRLIQHLGGRPQTTIFNFMMENYISKGYFFFEQNKSTFNNPIQEIRVKISPNSPVCWLCHRKLINFIILKYVQCMKYDEPIFMREDCYYGINCRFQQQRQHHAQKYNHFCEQTKFD